MQPPRPPFSQLVIYALGQFGWSLAAFGASNLLVYFYLPPEIGAEAVFPAFIYQGAILGVATAIGLINFGGRFFDAITDPLIASWSDQKKGQGGRRTRLMGIAALPFATLSFLIFYPPSQQEDWLNTAWLVATMALFYFFLTLYVVPYNALISELGHYPPDRMRISTFISVTFALGFLLGSNTYALQSWLETWYQPVIAFQLTLGGFAVLALVLMWLPVVALRERVYAFQPPTPEVASSWGALRQVWAFKPFRTYLWSDLMYWLALTFIQLGISYFITLLMGFDKSRASLFLTVGFLGSFLLYWPLNVAVARWGKRRVMLAAFALFSVVFGVTALMPWLAGWEEVLFWVLAAASAFPLAAFGIIPNALIADQVYAYGQQHGNQPAGMFYAVRSFMMKLGISLGNLVFPSLLLLGKGPDNSLGVQAAAWFALGCCVVGGLVFSQVPTADPPAPANATAVDY